MTHPEQTKPQGYEAVECFNVPWGGGAWGIGIDPKNRKPDLWTQNKRVAEHAATALSACQGIANPDKLGELLDALWFAREALRLTQEYVGDDLLPKLPGWSWFDGITRADAALAAIGALPAEAPTKGEGR